MDANDLAIQLYRVTSIVDNADNTYTMTGTFHNSDKYEHIDSGARVDKRPVTVILPGIQLPPKNVCISSFTQINQGIAITTLRTDWDASEHAIAYEAEWRRGNNNWVTIPRTSTLGFEVQRIYAVCYQVRVRAVNSSNISSIWMNTPETV